MSESAVSPQLAARRANLEKGQAVPKQIRYRMTEKRLAACRRNLEKARAVAPEIRFRRTEKRLEANRANLRKARERVRVTGATIRHGMICRTLEGSLAGAGETLEALRAFFGRFEALFRPGDTMETKLVQGLAQASWRRLRAFRLRARWERRKLAEVLREFGRRRMAATGWRRAKLCAPTGATGEPQTRGSAPAGDLGHPLPKGEGGDEKARLGRIIADHRSALQDERAADLKTRSALPEERTDCGDSSSAALTQNDTRPEDSIRALEMREGVRRVMGVFCACLGMGRSVRRLNRRITALVHVLLALRMMPRYEMNPSGVGVKRHHGLLEQSSEVLGNPLIRMSRLARGSRSGASREPMVYRTHGGQRRVCPTHDEPRLDDAEAWRERFLEALGAMDEGELELIERLARRAWKRLELFRIRAEKEERELERILSTPAAGELAMGLVASEIVLVFESDVALFDEAMRLEKELKGMMESLLARRSREIDIVRRAEAGQQDAGKAAEGGLGAVA